MESRMTILGRRKAMAVTRAVAVLLLLCSFEAAKAAGRFLPAGLPIACTMQESNFCLLST
jgi:hypothetical protein